MILDELLEKKDLMIYIKCKTQLLKRELDRINESLQTEELSKKQMMLLEKRKTMITGRVKELSKLNEIVHNGALRKRNHSLIYTCKRIEREDENKYGIIQTIEQKLNEPVAIYTPFFVEDGIVSNKVEFELR